MANNATTEAENELLDKMIVAFIQGAQWWEYQKSKATMWPSDRDLAEVEATCRAMNETLGKLPF